MDTQDNRLEADVWGFGGEDGTGSWLIAHDVFYGGPGRQDLWTRLDEFLRTPFEHESGANLRVSAVGVDSGGHYTTQVYNFCKKNATHR